MSYIQLSKNKIIFIKYFLGLLVTFLIVNFWFYPDFYILGGDDTKIEFLFPEKFFFSSIENIYNYKSYSLVGIFKSINYTFYYLFLFLLKTLFKNYSQIFYYSLILFLNFYIFFILLDKIGNLVFSEGYKRLKNLEKTCILFLFCSIFVFIEFNSGQWFNMLPTIISNLIFSSICLLLINFYNKKKLVYLVYIFLILLFLPTYYAAPNLIAFLFGSIPYLIFFLILILKNKQIKKIPLIFLSLILIFLTLNSELFSLNTHGLDKEEMTSQFIHLYQTQWTNMNFYKSFFLLQPELLKYWHSPSFKDIPYTYTIMEILIVVSLSVFIIYFVFSINLFFIISFISFFMVLQIYSPIYYFDEEIIKKIIDFFPQITLLKNGFDKSSQAVIFYGLIFYYNVFLKSYIHES